MKTNELTSPPRERVSVAITGIDRSTPDVIVEDGKCETLHNARYSGAAWRPTHPYKAIKEGISLPLATTIVYHHPASGEGKYITEYALRGMGVSNYTYALFDINSGESTNIITLNEQATISHFGNVLILNARGVNHRFIFANNGYRSVSAMLAPTLQLTNMADSYDALPDYFRLSKDVNKPTAVGKAEYFLANTWYHRDRLGEAIRAVKDWNAYVPSTGYDAVYPQITCLWLLSDADALNSCIPLTPDSSSNERAATAWHGEIALFAAYHTATGDVLNPSPLHLCVSDNTLPACTFEQKTFFSQYNGENIPNSDPDRRYIGCEVVFDWSNDISVASIREQCPYSYILPTLSITIDSRLNTELVEGVAIYATRINPIFDAALYTNAGNAIPPHKLWSQNNLPEQPFYLVKEFALSADLNGDYVDHFSLSLDSLILQQAIHNKTYAPSIQHDLSGDALLDYNNSVHMGGVHTTFREDGILRDALVEYNGGTESTPYVTISAGDKTYVVKGETTPSTGMFNTPYDLILSYHDYRAKRYMVTWDDVQSSFGLKPAPANNIAYFTMPSDDTHKYPSFRASSGTIPDTPITLPAYSDTLYEPNRIQVSAANNCFSFPFENSYSVGSSNNRILALQSAAIEMPEMKVGELPLYAFTTEGIFALIAGSETLYARVSAINYDKIINPNTLAINGAIAYITEKGVHLLTSNGSQVISTPIHDMANRPPLDFLRTCKMIYPKEHSEIILHNEMIAEGIAYVYNLDNGYWSTRTLNGRKLNTDEMYYDKTLYDLANEDETKALPMEIVTRPLKLGNVEFKRVESIIPRMATNEHAVVLDVDIEGSVDGGSYLPLRSIMGMDIEANRVNPLTIRRTPFSAKYFKMSFKLDALKDKTFNPSFSLVDIEWYRKLKHRMR